MELEWGFEVYEDFHKFGDPRIRIKEMLGVYVGVLPFWETTIS